MSAPAAADDLEARIEQEIERVRARRLEAFDPALLFHLAVVPAWTDRLAKEAGLPLRSRGLDETLAALVAAGMCLVERTRGRAGDPVTHARVVGILGGHVPDDEVRAAIRGLAGAGPARLRARGLIDVAPAVGPATLAEALVVARAFGGVDGGRAIGALAHRASGANRETLAEEALQASAEADSLERAEVIAAVVPLLPPERQAELLAGCLQVAATLSDEVARGQLLGRIAGVVPAQLAPTFAAVTSTLQDRATRAPVLAALALNLPRVAIRLGEDDQGPPSDPLTRISELSTTALALAQVGEFETAGQTIGQIDSPVARSRLLAAIFGQVSAQGVAPGAVLLADQAAQEAGKDGSDAGTRVVVQGNLAVALAASGAPDLAQAHAEASRDASRTLGRSIDGVEALAVLAQALRTVGDSAGAATAAQTALELAESTPDARTRATALAAVADELAPEVLAPAIERAFAAIATSADPVERASLVALLAPHADPGAVGAAVESTLAVERSGVAVTFSMPRTVRREVLAWLRKRADGTDVRARIAEIAARIDDASSRGAAVGEATARWANLARQVGSPTGVDAAGEWLDAQTAEAVRTGDLARAAVIVATGESVAEAIAEPFASVVRLAARRVALAHRRTQDDRHLATFLERQEQTDALRALLEPRATSWATHFLGMGGVGKTMLIRYLTARLAPELRAATARVDFDYLDPDYPVRRPGELMLALVGELESYAESTKAERLVRTIREDAVALHAQLATGAQLSDPVAGVETPEFRALVGSFAELVELLDRPVVLILDTCEELSKVPSANARMPAVEVTFRILELIHDRAPRVRVVLAGRRLLARSGDGWEVDETTTVAPVGLPASKPYLGLHVIRGFDGREAREFLRQKKGLDLDAATEDALMAASPDHGAVAGLRFTARRRDASDDQPRVSPFDLSIHADLAREIGVEGLADIRDAAGDVYVERRIVGRFVARSEATAEERQRGDDLRGLLPAVVLLRRFDRAMLREAFGGSDARFDAAFDALSQQEWIQHQPDPALDTTFLEVDRNLVQRLADWTGRPERRAELRATEAALGPRLAGLLASTPVERVPIDLVDAMLRLLPPVEASAAFDAHVRAIATGNAYDRARRLTERLLAPDGTIETVARSLAAAVRALHAAALIHTRADDDPAPHWAEADAALDQEPDPGIRRWLGARIAIAALIEAGPEPLEGILDLLGAAIEPGPEGALDDWHREQLAGSLVAVLDSIVQRAEDDGRPIDPTSVEGVAERVGTIGSPPLAAFAAILAVRALAAAGDRSAALERLARLRPPSIEDGSTGQPWLDWVAPGRLAARIALERLRIAAALPHGERDALPLESVAADLSTIDAERLASATLLHHLADRVVGPAILEELGARDAYHADRQPRCAAHRATPPLVVVIAQAWLAAGDPQRALDLLATRRDEAYRSGRDQATGIALDRATAAIARRLRLHDPYRSVIDRLAASADPDEVALAAPVVALTEGTLDDPQLGLAATAPSLWWRVQVPLRPEARARIAEIATRAWASLPEPPYEPRPASEVALAFDAFEGGRVFAGSPDRPSTSPRSLAFTLEFWGAAHPGEPEAAARLAVRAAMLGATIAVSPIAVPEPSLRWVESVPILVGRRRAAELAFEEAELLALRLPMESRQALDQAARWFEQSGDLTGALFARTRSAIAAAHAGFDAAREPARRELREAFDAVRAARPATLPSFDDLLQAARSSDAGLLPGAGGSPWTPWLQRISVAAAWAAGAPGDPAPAVVRGVPAELPIEVVIDPEALVLPEGAWPMLRRFGQAAAFLGGVYVALYLVQWLATGNTPAWYGPIVTGFVFFVAIGVIALVFRSAGTGLRASAVLAAHVGIDASAPSGDDGAPSVSLRVEAPDFRDGGTLAEPTATGLLASALVLPWEAVFGLRIAYRRVAPFADGPLGPIGDTYRTAASAIPDQVGASVRDLAARTGGVPLPVAIRSAPGLVELPWEAMVALAAESRSDDRAGAAVVPYREAGLVSGPRRGGRRTTIQVAAGVGWQSLSAAWKRTGFTRLLELAEVHPGSAILHLVGRPVVGEGEIVLQLGLGSAVSKGATVESQARGDGAIRLGSLDLSSVALVLIQAEPEAAEERQESDRRKAERLRRLAEDAIAANAETVVVIPALPPALAEAVLELVAARLGPVSRLGYALEWLTGLVASRRDAPTYSRPRLTGTLADARALVRRWPEDHPEAGGNKTTYEELALDLTIVVNATPRATATSSNVLPE